MQNALPLPLRNKFEVCKHVQVSSIYIYSIISYALLNFKTCNCYHYCGKACCLLDYRMRSEHPSTASGTGPPTRLRRRCHKIKFISIWWSLNVVAICIGIQLTVSPMTRAAAIIANSENSPSRRGLSSNKFLSFFFSQNSVSNVILRYRSRIWNHRNLVGAARWILTAMKIMNYELWNELQWHWWRISLLFNTHRTDSSLQHWVEMHCSVT